MSSFFGIGASIFNFLRRPPKSLNTLLGLAALRASMVGQGGENLADIYWYTTDGRLYLYFAQNNQTAELGKYYIEDGKMLITASSGEKLLLFRE